MNRSEHTLTGEGGGPASSLKAPGQPRGLVRLFSSAEIYWGVVGGNCPHPWEARGLA